MNQDTSIEARFEGHEITENGTAPIPNMLLWYYRDLGLLDAQCALLIHIIARKWTREAPYPSLARLPMTANLDSRRRYVRDLRQKGLLFTSRMYWTKEDITRYPYAHPGRVRSNIWYLGSLLHNLVRIHHWLEGGQALDDFQVEIPLVTVKKFLRNEFHDTPAHIARAIKEQTQEGIVFKSVLLVCEKHTVEKSTMRFSSSSFSSSRKTHSHEEESDSKKNQKRKKNQKKGAGAPARKKKDVPVSVQAYRSVANRYPDKATWEMIAETVGDTPEGLEFWKKVVRAYIGCGWNKLNISAMLEFFKKGVLPTTEPTKNGGNNHGPNSKRSGIKGLRELGSDDPIKFRFNTTTGEEYYVDARSNERVHPPECPCYTCHPENRAEWERLNAGAGA